MRIGPRGDLSARLVYMITVTCLGVLIVLLVILRLSSAGGPLDVRERLYLLASPVPSVLAFVLPGPIRQLIEGSGGTRPWVVALTEVGGWLSLALVVAGAVLLWRRWTHGHAWDHRLLVGLVVAALPAFMIGLVALMYAL
jgi:hypothetical protein